MEMTVLTDTRRVPGALRSVLVLALALIAGALGLPASGEAAAAAPTVSTAGASNVGLLLGDPLRRGQSQRAGHRLRLPVRHEHRPMARRRRCAPGGQRHDLDQGQPDRHRFAAGTTYHYRIVAISPAGTTDGKDRTFTTAKVPLSLRSPVPNPVMFGNPFLVEGNLSGTGRRQSRGRARSPTRFPTWAASIRSATPR